MRKKRLNKNKKFEIIILLVAVAFAAALILQISGLTGFSIYGIDVPEEQITQPQEPAAYESSAVGTSTYTLTDSTNNKAYHKDSGGTLVPAAPNSPGFVEYTGTQYTYAASLDGLRNAWEPLINSLDTDNEYGAGAAELDYVNLYYKIKINESVGDIINMTVKWVGYDPLATFGSHFVLFIWKDFTSSWSAAIVESEQQSSDQTYTYPITSGISDRIDGSGYFYIGISGAAHSAGIDSMDIAPSGPAPQPRIYENYVEVEVNFISGPSPPDYDNFPLEYGTTNFSAVANITNVSNMALGTQYGIIRWVNPVNADGEDYDSYIKINESFVSINTPALNETINATARVTLYNINCSDFTLHYAPGFYSTVEGLITDSSAHIIATEANINGNCTDDTICQNISCVGGENGNLSFTAQHFTGFGVGNDTLLAIWDETDAGTKFPNQQVKFFANYTYSNGTFISDANCTINFAGSAGNDMTLNATAGLFEYNRSFSYVGDYDWDVTCNRTGLITLSASDSATISAPISTYTLADSTNNKAYYDTSLGTNPPEAPGDSDYTVYTGTHYTNAAAQDFNINPWGNTGGFSYVNLLYAIKINESVGDILNINLTWVGFDRLLQGGQLALYARNHTSNTWLNWATDSTSRTSDQTYTYNYISGFSDLINSSGYMHIGVSGAYLGLFCPFVYSYDGIDYIFDNYILRGLITKGNENISYSILSKIKEPRIKIANELNEIEYIDSLGLKVTDTLGTDSKIFTLKPISITGASLDLILETDNEYLVLQEGDEYFIQFEPIPSKQEGCEREIGIIASGFYEPLDTEEQTIAISFPTIYENYFEVEVYQVSSSLPNYDNFPTEYGTTEFSAVPDITNVSNMTLGTQYGKIKWINPVNAEGEDYDSNIRINGNFVSIMTRYLDATINATANVTLYNVNCSDFTLHYAPGFYSTSERLITDPSARIIATEANIGSNCTDDTVCIDVSCVGGENGNLSFIAQHFTGFGVGNDTFLTIWDDTDSGTKYNTEQVMFFANYTYSNGTFISNANCTINFNDSSSFMYLNPSAGLFEYNRSFSSAGIYEWNVTCNKTGLTTLTAVDDATITFLNCSCNTCIGCITDFNNALCPVVNLTANIIDTSGTCLDLNSMSNKVFEGNGFIMDLNAAPILEYDPLADVKYGVRFFNSNNITIRNCTFSEFDYGAHLTSSGNITLFYVNTNKSSNSGIYLTSSSGNNFTHVNSFSNILHGIEMVSSSNGNTFSSVATYSSTSGSGISITASSGNIFTGIDSYSNSQYGVYLSSSPNNNFSYMDSHDNNQFGVYLSSSSGNNFTNVNSSSNSYGFILMASSGNIFNSAYTHSNNDDGFFFFSSSGNNLTDITSYNNIDDGIYLRSSSNIFNSVKTYDNNDHGIFLELSANYNNFTHVNSSNNSIGIHMSLSTGNNLTNVRAYNNSQQGIYLYQSSNDNHFTDANVYNNSDKGILIEGSYGNIFTGNNLSENTNANLYIKSNFNNTFSSSVIAPYTIFAESGGNEQLKYTDTLNLTTAVNFGDVIALSSNSVFVDSSAKNELNKSAQLKMYGLSFTDAVPVWDPEDDGTFETCPASVCTEVSYSSGVFIYNVTHFTNYSSQQNCSCTNCSDCTTILGICDEVNLTANITGILDTCINWPADNKTFDCNNNYISGNSTPESYIYAGGGGLAQTVSKYASVNMSYLGGTPSYGGEIQTIVIDGDYIYAGGYTDEKVKKYNKTSLAYINATAHYGYRIISIAVDDNHVYAGGGTPYTVKKYNKSNDMSYVGETPSYGSYIFAVFVDDDYIYAGGMLTQTVRKYNKTSLAYISETADFGSVVQSIVVEGDYIYAGGYQSVKKYYKTNMSYIGQTANYGGGITSFVIDGDYIYAGGSMTQKVRKYNKTSLAYIGETTDYGGVIYSVAVDNNYVYAAGDTTETVRMYNKGDLSYISETPGYGGTIKAIDVEEAEPTDYGIYLNGKSNNIIRNCNIDNFDTGVYLESSSNNSLTSLNIQNNTLWDFGSSSNSLNNHVINFTSWQNVLSFESKDINLKGLQVPEAPFNPLGYANVSKYINATKNSADSWLHVNFSYSDPADLGEIIENTIFVARNNGTWETDVSSFANNYGIDTSNDYVYANITEFGSTFAPLGEVNCSCVNCSDCNLKAQKHECLTVTLVNNISNIPTTCINFTEDNKIIDCQGGYIAGTGHDYGVHIRGQNNSIRNCTVRGFDIGVVLDSSSGGSFSDLKIHDNDDYVGIWMISSSNNVFNSIEIWNHDFGGIWMESSSNNNSFTDIQVHNNNDDGIFIEDSSNNTFTSVDVYSNIAGGIDLYSSSGNSFYLVNSYYNTGTGIDLREYSNSNNFTNVRAWNNFDEGISLEDSSNNSFNNITSYNSQYGILVSASDSNNFTSINTYNNNNTGIYLSASDSNILTPVNAWNNTGKGILLYGNYNTIEDSNMTGNGIGIYMNVGSGYLSDHNNITGNNISFNTGDGIHIANGNSSNNRIEGNNISSNTGDGIEVYIEAGLSSARIFNNNLITNNKIKDNSGKGIYFNIKWYVHTIYNNTIYNNDIYNNDYGIYFNRTNSNNITGNNISSNTNDGIYIENSVSDNVFDNLIYDNNYGIYLDGSSYSNIKENNITKNKDGVFVYGNYNNVTHNYISHNRGSGHGIQASGTYVAEPFCTPYGETCTPGVTLCCYPNICIDKGDGFKCQTSGGAGCFNVFAHNTIWNATYGLAIENTDNETVLNNTIRECDYGVYFNNTVDCDITRNRIYNNSETGIYFDNSSRNAFLDNIIANNSINEIYLGDGSIENTFTNQLISSYPTNISFIYDPNPYTGNISIKGVDNPPADPAGWHNISKYVNITNNNGPAWLFLNVSYSDSDILHITEYTLKIWKHNGSWIQDSWNGERILDQPNNVVGVNITRFGSIFAPLGFNNTEPNTTQVFINSSSGNNYTTDNLTCWAIGEDGQQVNLTAFWQWYNGSSPFLSGSTGISNGTLTNITVLSSNYTIKNENWICSVKMYDSYTNETDWNNATITILNSPPVSIPIPNQTWDEDTSNSNAFDLDDYFTDADNDNLTYNYTQAGSNIIISVSSDNQVSFSQPADWYGIEYVVFNATDGGYTVQSNNITLTVTDVAEPAPPSAVAPRGGGLGSICSEQWNCSEWSACTTENKQYRECWDLNRCEEKYTQRIVNYVKKAEKPAEVRDCVYTGTCSDGMQNQGETGIDCGGPCPPCPSCFDGTKNQGETGIDCGGPCPPCIEMPVAIEKINLFWLLLILLIAFTIADGYCIYEHYHKKDKTTRRVYEILAIAFLTGVIILSAYLSYVNPYVLVIPISLIVYIIVITWHFSMPLFREEFRKRRQKKLAEKRKEREEKARAKIAEKKRKAYIRQKKLAEKRRREEIVTSQVAAIKRRRTLAKQKKEEEELKLKLEKAAEKRKEREEKERIKRQKAAEKRKEREEKERIKRQKAARKAAGKRKEREGIESRKWQKAAEKRRETIYQKKKIEEKQQQKAAEKRRERYQEKRKLGEKDRMLEKLKKREKEIMEKLKKLKKEKY